MTTKVQPVGEEELAAADTLSVFQSATAVEQEKLNKIQQLVFSEQLLLKQIKDEQIQQQGEFNQKLRTERGEFERTCHQRESELKLRAKELQDVDTELQARVKEAEQLMTKAASVKQQQDSVLKERIEVEKLKAKASELLESANQRHLMTETQYADLSVKHTQVLALDARITSKEKELEAKESELFEKAEQVAEQTKHYQALKAGVEPKLAEFAKQEAQAKETYQQLSALKEKAEEEQVKATQAKAEVQLLADRYALQEQALNDRELKLQQLASELRVKAQQLKAQGVTDVREPEPEVKRGPGRPKKGS